MISAGLGISKKRMIKSQRARIQARIQSFVQFTPIITILERQSVQRQRGFTVQLLRLLLHGIKVVLASGHPHVAKVPGIIFRLWECEWRHRKWRQWWRQWRGVFWRWSGCRFGAVVRRCEFKDESGSVPHLPGAKVESNEKIAELRNVLKVADNHTVVGEVGCFTWQKKFIAFQVGIQIPGWWYIVQKVKKWLIKEC